MPEELFASDLAGRQLAGLVARPRLLQQLSRGLVGRLTLIVAPAGYGKSVLLSDWIRLAAAARPVLWYPLGEADNEPVHLLQGLSASLAATQAISGSLSIDSQSPPAYALDLLFRQAAAITQQPWLVVLDDFHLLTNPVLLQAFERLLSLTSWPVHLVIASRSEPPLTAIARLRIEGRLVELDEVDLRFTDDETAVILSSTGCTPDAETLRQVVEHTEGWPVAAQLLCQAAQRRARPDLSAVLRARDDERPLFDYLTGQVLTALPADLQSFLRRTALLPYLEADLCNAYLGRTDAAAVLRNLERQRLFLTRVATALGRRYRYHALFQAFLVNNLEEVEGAAAMAAWRHQAAECLLCLPLDPTAEQHLDEHCAAIAHLLACRDWPAAADQVEHLAERLDWGRLTLMETWFDHLPAAEVANRPRLLLALGLLRERQSRWDEALAALTQAERLLTADDPYALLGSVLHRQAWIHFRQGHYARVKELCSQALDVLAGKADSAREQAHVSRLLGGAYAETDDLERGEAYMQRSLALFRSVGDRAGEARVLSNLGGTVYLNQGRLQEAIQYEQISLRLFDEMNSYQVCFVLARLGDAYRLTGAYTDANAVLTRLLEMTDAHQDPMMRGYALYSLGHLHRERGEHTAARTCYEEALPLGEELQEPALRFEPRLGLALLALDVGDLTEAQRQAHHALVQAQAVGFLLFKGQAQILLGQIAEASGDLAQAMIHYAGATDLLETFGATYDLTMALLCRASLHQGQNDSIAAAACLREALILSQQRDYGFLFTTRERRRALPLLAAAWAYAETAGRDQAVPAAEATRLLVRCGQHAVEPLLARLAIEEQPAAREHIVQILGQLGDERALPALAALRKVRALRSAAEEALVRIAAAPRPSLRVLSLGGFQVLRGDVPIPADAWQPRRKARLLYLYLLQHHQRLVPRDELLDALWPDLSPDSAALAFNTTFSDLRHILEPFLGKGAPSRYLMRDEETVGLSPSGAVWYDATAFEQAIQAGGTTARQALALYRGDFLPEEPYHDWALRERERLRNLYLNALMEWVAESVHADAWREGIDLAQRILQQAPWLEEVSRALMTCYAGLGRRSEALRTYHACVRALRQEMDVAPSAETIALYHQLAG